MSRNKADVPPTPARRFLRRAGLVATLFFLLKGLLWIAVPTTLFLSQCGAPPAATETHEP
ncbi:MAG: hypothetical protein R2752_13370 [Vicinamibacterales bacterium]